MKPFGIWTLGICLALSGLGTIGLSHADDGDFKPKRGGPTDSIGGGTRHGEADQAERLPASTDTTRRALSRPPMPAPMAVPMPAGAAPAPDPMPTPDMTPVPPNSKSRDDAASKPKTTNKPKTASRSKTTSRPKTANKPKTTNPPQPQPSTAPAKK